MIYTQSRHGCKFTNISFFKGVRLGSESLGFFLSESHNTRFILAQENAHFYFDTFYTIHIIFHRENATALRLNYSLIIGTRRQRVGADGEAASLGTSPAFLCFLDITAFFSSINVPAQGPVYSIWPMEILHISSLQVIFVLVWSKLSPYYWSFCEY